MRSFLSSYRKSTLARNTGWMFLGQGLRIAIQASYFIIIARSLGVKEYGAFAAVVAMVAIVSPFVGLGSGNLIVQNVSREHALLEECFGNGVVMILATGLLGVGAVLGICRWMLPTSIPLAVILMVALADLVFYRQILLVAGAFQAVEKLDKTA